MCVLILVIFALTIPTLVFLFVYSHEESDISHTCNILQNFRIPCGPPGPSLPKECEAINCCYNVKTKRCYHTLPSKYQYVSNDQDWENGFVPMLDKSPFGKSNEQRIYLSYTNTSDEVLFTLDNKK